MSWIFLIIGAIIGNIPGAIVGYIIGSLIDAGIKKNNENINRGSSGNTNQRPHAERQSGLTYEVKKLIDAMLLIANADNEISHDEISFVIHFFVNSGVSNVNALSSYIQQRISNIPNIFTTCNEINKFLNYTEKLYFLDILFKIALSDGFISNDEVKKIRQIAHLLNIKSNDFFSIQNPYIQENQKTDKGYRSGAFDPYKVLGVSQDATSDEIKRAFRKLAKKFHPDKLVNAGEDFKKMAEEKMKDINRAYSLLNN
ncbi:DnaJ domain-containing protein [bacterium]|nr:DnaJ domain-containing protein [bacterium]